MLSLNRFAAVPVYSWQLAQPEATMCGLKDYGDNIYSIVGAELLILGEQEGTVQKKKHIGFGPVCPPARNNSFFYVPGTDRRVSRRGPSGIAAGRGNRSGWTRARGST